MQTNVIFPQAAQKCQTAWLSVDKKQNQYSGLLCFSQTEDIALNKNQKNLCCNGKMRKEFCLSRRKQAANVIKYHPKLKTEGLKRPFLLLKAKAAVCEKCKILSLEITEVCLFLAFWMLSASCINVVT